MPPTRSASILCSKLTFFQISHSQEHKAVENMKAETYQYFVLVIHKSLT